LEASSVKKLTHPSAIIGHVSIVAAGDAEERDDQEHRTDHHRGLRDPAHV